MIGKAVGAFFCYSRDAVARGLLKLKVTPNVLTVVGTAIMTGVGVCFALGAGRGFAWTLGPRGDNAYILLAAGLIILSCACDMLDGAVARLGNLKTTFGAFLDSTLDRYSDFAIFAGIAVGYAAQANITFTLLSMLAFFHGFMISYTRARAEDIIDCCEVGYWQRGERMAAVLIASLSLNLPALILQQSTLPALTVLRRMGYTWNVLHGRNPLTDPRQGGWWLKIRLWRWPRMTLPYDLVTGLNIAWLIFAPAPATDVLRMLG